MLDHSRKLSKDHFVITHVKTRTYNILDEVKGRISELRRIHAMTYRAQEQQQEQEHKAQTDAEPHHSQRQEAEAEHQEQDAHRGRSSDRAQT